ncbi:PREDICTED: translation initiation factor IF-2-like [Corvus brachyrhynchos]|uniref:translation initiation factor IF-2-like n=1 Tax=Corvus brachyrhynchos TaxID=85066 RepID=UPI00081649C2|nr:PREDICTED: translation initiation factor IF-2-like [Corvus brachyrhynchos]
MLFWHGQPDHYWSSPGDMYPLPSSGVLRYPPNPPKSAGFGETEARPSAHPFRGVFSCRDPPVLPYLKQEEPNGISTSQPPVPAFQYVLCAPTSPAVRHHEETLTYLNQGQSYEIRMMGTPRGDPAEGRRMVKVSRVGTPGLRGNLGAKLWAEVPVQSRCGPISAPGWSQFSPSSTQVQFKSSPSSASVQPRSLSYPSPAPAQPQSNPSSAPAQPSVPWGRGRGVRPLNGVVTPPVSRRAQTPPVEHFPALPVPHTQGGHDKVQLLCPVPRTEQPLGDPRVTM